MQDLPAQRILPCAMESSRGHPHLGVRKPTELTSYRPISLLPMAPKLFEKLLLKRLLKMVENNGFIPNHHFGFRESHSIMKQTN
jgi:hypothetical protein